MIFLLEKCKWFVENTENSRFLQKFCCFSAYKLMIFTAKPIFKTKLLLELNDWHGINAQFWHSHLDKMMQQQNICDSFNVYKTFVSFQTANLKIIRWIIRVIVCGCEHTHLSACHASLCCLNKGFVHWFQWQRTFEKQALHLHNTKSMLPTTFMLINQLFAIRPYQHANFDSSKTGHKTAYNFAILIVFVQVVSRQR